MSADGGPESIAEELDEDIAVIRPIYEVAKAYGPDYDCDKIYGELLNGSASEK